ncbi:MAG: DUF423 domain-containing protein [Bradyrhizobium sp.]|nr:DUF423 domain-containing protein [Bradyrhizobium sp.]
MGASGVMLAAASAHGSDAGNLAPASAMLLVHAAAVLAAAALAERGVVHVRIGVVAGFGLLIGAALFAGSVALRHYTGYRPFPFAAPTGGAIMIVSWLTLGIAAALPRWK